MVKQRAQKIKLDILNDLDAQTKFFFWALDVWTSPNKLAFMGIMAYFMDSRWRYREVLLHFHSLEGTHSGANMG